MKTKEEFINLLQNGIYEVTFNKKGTGEPRTLTCTLDKTYLPEPKPSTKEKAEPSTDAVRVYEVELESWRSFNASSVTGFKLVSV